MEDNVSFMSGSSDLLAKINAAVKAANDGPNLKVRGIPMTDTKPRLVAGRRIKIEDEWWWPRKEIAAEVGITDRAAARMNWRTVYIGRVAHCPHDASIREIASRAERQREPERQRERRSRRSRSASVAA
jgi:hypothetical protein